MPKTVKAREENLVVSGAKSFRKIQQKKNSNVVIVQSGENIIYNTLTNIYKRSLCSVVEDVFQSVQISLTSLV